MKIKAISLWQPWASLIALGAKKFETRSWSTPYRGPLLICASKRPPDEDLLVTEPFKSALRDLIHADGIVTGAAVCVVDLVGCYRTHGHFISLPEPHGNYALTPTEYAFGDFTPGRWAWQMKNIRTPDRPFAVRGAQGLFEVEVDDALVMEAAVSC